MAEAQVERGKGVRARGPLDESGASGGHHPTADILAPGLAARVAAEEATLKGAAVNPELRPLRTAAHVQIRRGEGVGHRTSSTAGG